MSKTALIVGAGSGLSAALARQCHAAGMTVSLAARDGAKAAAVAAETWTGGSCFFSTNTVRDLMPVDLTTGDLNFGGSSIVDGAASDPNPGGGGWSRTWRTTNAGIWRWQFIIQ